MNRLIRFGVVAAIAACVLAGNARADERVLGDSRKTATIEDYLIVHNHTSYYITIYVDGASRGTVAPYDTAKTYVGKGSYDVTRLRGDDGIGHSWHRTVDVASNGNFHWHLYP